MFPGFKTGFTPIESPEAPISTPEAPAEVKPLISTKPAQVEQQLRESLGYKPIQPGVKIGEHNVRGVEPTTDVIPEQKFSSDPRKAVLQKAGATEDEIATILPKGKVAGQTGLTKVEMSKLADHFGVDLGQSAIGRGQGDIAAGTHITPHEVLQRILDTGAKPADIAKAINEGKHLPTVSGGTSELIPSKKPEVPAEQSPLNMNPKTLREWLKYLWQNEEGSAKVPFQGDIPEKWKGNPEGFAAARAKIDAAASMPPTWWKGTVKEWREQPLSSEPWGRDAEGKPISPWQTKAAAKPATASTPEGQAKINFDTRAALDKHNAKVQDLIDSGTKPARAEQLITDSEKDLVPSAASAGAKHDNITDLSDKSLIKLANPKGEMVGSIKKTIRETLKDNKIPAEEVNELARDVIASFIDEVKNGWQPEHEVGASAMQWLQQTARSEAVKWAGKEGYEVPGEKLASGKPLIRKFEQMPVSRDTGADVPINVFGRQSEETVTKPVPEMQEVGKARNDSPQRDYMPNALRQEMENQSRAENQRRALQERIAEHPEDKSFVEAINAAQGHGSSKYIMDLGLSRTQAKMIGDKLHMEPHEVRSRFEDIRADVRSREQPVSSLSPMGAEGEYRIGGGKGGGGARLPIEHQRISTPNAEGPAELIPTKPTNLELRTPAERLKGPNRERTDARGNAIMFRNDNQLLPNKDIGLQGGQPAPLIGGDKAVGESTANWYARHGIAAPVEVEPWGGTTEPRIRPSGVTRARPYEGKVPPTFPKPPEPRTTFKEGTTGPVVSPGTIDAAARVRRAQEAYDRGTSAEQRAADKAELDAAKIVLQKMQALKPTGIPYTGGTLPIGEHSALARPEPLIPAEGTSHAVTEGKPAGTEQLIPTTGVSSAGNELGAAAEQRLNTARLRAEEAVRNEDRNGDPQPVPKEGTAAYRKYVERVKTTQRNYEAEKAKSKGASPIRQISENYLDDVLGNRNPATPDLIPV
jgi:hypothetical protein